MQFYQSEYANDIESLTIAHKGMLLEPFVHTSDADLKTLGMDNETLKRKFYFNEWFKSVPQSDILRLTVEELKNSLDKFLITVNYGQSEVQ